MAVGTLFIGTSAEFALFLPKPGLGFHLFHLTTAPRARIFRLGWLYPPLGNRFG